MTELSVALVELAYDDEADIANRRADVAELVATVGADVDLVVLPELWLAGAFTPRRWSALAEPVDGPTVTALAEAARAAGCCVHVGAFVEQDGEARHNTAVLLGPDGAVLASYRKIHLFAAGGREGELLVPGDEVVVAELPLRGGGTARVGLATCYDLRFPELFRALRAADPQVLLLAASWPAAKGPAWRTLTAARAIENQAYVVACNATGASGRTPMLGESRVLDPLGAPCETVERARWPERLPAPATRPEEAHNEIEAVRPTRVLRASLDLDVVEQVRADFPIWADRAFTVAPPVRLT